MISKHKPVTIHDIAAEAGVSASTVSRVLNGTTPVANAKRAAVLAAIESLNYHPNVVAQGLVRGKSATIGVLTQDLASPFYAEIHRAVEEGLVGSGYHPLFASGHWGADLELAALDVLIKRRVDAIIVLGGLMPGEHLHAVAQELPLVAVGRLIAGIEDRCLHVDHAEGAYKAMRYLIELGHTRIAHITGLPYHPDAIDRQAGYRQALDDAGLAVDPNLVVEGTFDEQSGLLAVEMLLARGAMFTALFAANDQMAQGARLALFRRGIRVPDDVSLIGFDDQPSSAFTTPPLTTVRQPTAEMGAAAAEAVLKMLNGCQPSLPNLSVDLVIRESAVLYRRSRFLQAR
jgi:LacI family transcriptional regulator